MSFVLPAPFFEFLSYPIVMKQQSNDQESYQNSSIQVLPVGIPLYFSHEIYDSSLDGFFQSLMAVNGFALIIQLIGYAI